MLSAAVVADDILKLILLSFRAIQTRHFMRIASLEDDSHEISSLIFSEK